MAKVWTECILPSQVAFMNEIIAQVPDTGGARTAFIDILQALADSSEAKAPQIYIIAGEGDVRITSSLESAREAAKSEEHYVVDPVTCTWLCSDDPTLNSVIAIEED